MDFLINFDDMKAGNRALRKLTQAFFRAGTPVAAADIDPKLRRSAGVTYRQVLITFNDNQRLLLGVKQSGDIFEVKLNGSKVPLKNQDDQHKAVAEIAQLVEAGRKKFQARLARTRVVMPKGLKTAAPRMEVRLQEANDKLDQDIVAARTRVNELRAELGEPALDDATLSGTGEESKPEAADLPQDEAEQSQAAPQTAVDDEAQPGAKEAESDKEADDKPECPPSAEDKAPENDEAAEASQAAALDAAHELADSLIAGNALDSVTPEQAQESLAAALDAVEKGRAACMEAADIEGAVLHKAAATTFRKALAILDEATQPE